MLVGAGTSGSVSSKGAFESLIFLSKKTWDNISDPIEQIGWEIVSNTKSFFVFFTDFLTIFKSKGFIVWRSMWSKYILFLLSSFLKANTSMVDKEYVTTVKSLPLLNNLEKPIWLLIFFFYKVFFFTSV